MHHSFEQLSLVCAFRALPFAVYACGTPRICARAKWIAGISYALCIALTWFVRSDAWFAWSLCGVVYYAACSELVPALSGALRDRRITKGALFAACAALYLVVPTALFPQYAHSAFLVLGWELTLSSYSYGYESSAVHAVRTRADRLFFLFVNPMLTYANRGKFVSEPKLSARGLLRVALGVAWLYVAAWLLRPLARVLADARFEPGWLYAAVLGTSRLLALYAAHSGLASFQIGLLRQFGYAVPERYRYPLAAKDPLDLWRRWNTYVGGWLRRYVFIPAARHWGRAHPDRTRALALFTTMAASGLLHDGYAYLGTSIVSTRACQFFLMSGLAAALWQPVARRTASITGRHPALSVLARPLSHSIVLGCVVLACYVWGDA